MKDRRTLIAQLGRQTFDLLVIGGGIVGAGIARDAVMRGLKVALIEQGDFGSGASSKTSKLIHGGLRYLESRQFKLVSESLRERRTLRSIAPGLVKPFSFILPAFAGSSRPLWKMRLGLWFYDRLASGKDFASHHALSAADTLSCVPELEQAGLQGSGVYTDCQMDDARLCLANILQAVTFGAVCCNYVRMLDLIKVSNRICGADVEDALTGKTYEIRAQVVVNAAGPWADRLRQLCDPAASRKLAPTKGTHLVLPRLADWPIFSEARKDKRMFFVLPWGAHTLVGTTESAVDAELESLRASDNDMGYLLEETNRLLPGRHIKPQDVLASFAGARPLLSFSGNPNTASREHQIEINRFGLISILGGKFTTYRWMAQQTVDVVMRVKQWSLDRCLSARVSLIEEASPLALQHFRAVARSLQPEPLGELMVRYGAGVLPLLEIIERDGTMAHPVCVHHDTLWAELAYHFRHELACTLTDVLVRRTRIAFSPCQGLELLPTLQEVAQRYGGVSYPEAVKQAEHYRRYLDSNLSAPGHSRREIYA